MANFLLCFCCWWCFTRWQVANTKYSEWCECSECSVCLEFKINPILLNLGLYVQRAGWSLGKPDLAATQSHSYKKANNAHYLFLAWNGLWWNLPLVTERIELALFYSLWTTYVQFFLPLSHTFVHVNFYILNTSWRGPFRSNLPSPTTQEKATIISTESLRRPSKSATNFSSFSTISA